MTEYHCFIKHTSSDLFEHYNLLGKMCLLLKSGHLYMYMFASLKHIMMLLKFNFLRASFKHHITDTDNM